MIVNFLILGIISLIVSLIAYANTSESVYYWSTFISLGVILISLAFHVAKIRADNSPKIYTVSAFADELKEIMLFYAKELTDEDTRHLRVALKQKYRGCYINVDKDDMLE